MAAQTRALVQQPPPGAGSDQRHKVASRCCPSAGCSCAIPQAAWRHALRSRPVPTIGHARLCNSSSNAGAVKRPSRKAAPIWASKPNGSGRIVPSSARCPVCWVSTPSWRCWPMRCIPMGEYQSNRPLGIPKPTRRLQMCWPLSVTMDGAIWVIQPRQTPQTL
jgi:hypothetical protein